MDNICLFFFFSLNGVILSMYFFLKIFWAGSSYQNFLRRSIPGYCRPRLNMTPIDLSSHRCLTIIVSYITFTQETTLLIFSCSSRSFAVEWKSKQGQNEDRAWALLGHLDRKLMCVVTFFLLRAYCIAHGTLLNIM